MIEKGHKKRKNGVGSKNLGGSASRNQGRGTQKETNGKEGETSEKSFKEKRGSK